MLERSFVDNPRLIILAIAMLIMAGISALKTLPRNEDPTIINRFAMVFTQFPGATAERVEALVTEPLENKLRQLPEIKNLVSSSLNGLSSIVIEIQDDMTVQSSLEIWSRSRDLLKEASVTLPAGTSEPMFYDKRFHGYTSIIALNWKADGKPDQALLNRYSKELAIQLRALPGVDYVRTYGDVAEEISVEVDPLLAVGAQLSLGVISQHINAADTKLSAGQVVNQQQHLNVELDGELDSSSRIRRIPLRQLNDGQTLYVGDIATVERKLQSPASNISLVHGKQATVVAVRMISDLRIDNWTKTLNSKLANFQQNLPQSLELEIIFNQNQYTQARLVELMDNILLGFVLILSVLLISLGWRSALIVASALPLTVFFTLSCMQFYGLPIHQISVTGLIVALGIMVDNAIVMSDAIAQLRQKGHSAVQATSKAIRHLWLPLLGSTLTTILGFLPIVLMPGPAGEFVGGIALSVIFALIGSYVISHTIIAGLAGHFSLSIPEQKKRWYLSGLESKKLSTWFSKSLTLALEHPRKTILIMLILPCIGFYGSGHLKEQFFPLSDRDMFSIEIYQAKQSSLESSLETAKRAAAYIEAKEGVESAHWFIGSHAPSFYYNLFQNYDGSPFFSQGMITSDHFTTANALIPTLQEELDALFPHASVLVKRLDQGPPFNAPIELRIYGPNLDTLAQLGRELRAIMSENPSITQTRSTLAESVPTLRLKLDEEALLHAGLTHQDVAKQFRQALDGQVAGHILEVTEQLPIRVRYPQSSRSSADALENLYLIPNSNSGDNTLNALPLSAVGNVELQPSRSLIPRRNGERMNGIEAFIKTDTLASDVLKQLEQALEEKGFSVPTGYRLEIGGEDEKRDNAIGNLMTYISLIFTLLVLVVVLSFNSFRMSSIIFIAAFLSTGLGFLSSYIAGHPFGFISIVALLGLMGLAINAAIVILAELKASKDAIRADKEACVKAILSCSRHISSTTITTVGGFLPLMLSGGGFWPPFATVIAGGTVMTTLISFYVVPCLFILYAKRRPFELSASAY